MNPFLSFRKKYSTSSSQTKHRDSKLRFSELLPVSVAFQTSHTALEADCPGNSGTKQEVPFTKSTLESHSLITRRRCRSLFVISVIAPRNLIARIGHVNFSYGNSMSAYFHFGLYCTSDLACYLKALHN